MATGYEKFKRKEEKKKKKYEERTPEKVKKDYEKKAKKERIKGKKNQMAHSKRTKYRGIMHYDKDDKIDRLTYKYLRKADKLELKAIKKDWSEEPILPGDYNVEAICFCTGKTDKGADFGSTWDWNFLATPEWLTKNGYPTEDGISLLF